MSIKVPVPGAQFSGSLAVLHLRWKFWNVKKRFMEPHMKFLFNRHSNLIEELFEFLK